MIDGNLETTEFNKDNFIYAGFWVRTGATLIDTFLIFLLTIPLTLVLYGQAYFTKEAYQVLGTADLIINYILPTALVLIFWIVKSSTPGKMVLGMKIVDASTGKDLDFLQSIGRYISYIPAIIPFFFGIFWVGWDPKKQGWHDKLANTVVIRNRVKTEEVNFIQG